MCTYVETHRMIYLRFVNFTVCKIYFKIRNYKQMNCITNMLAEVFWGNIMFISINISTYLEIHQNRRDWWMDRHIKEQV